MDIMYSILRVIFMIVVIVGLVEMVLALRDRAFDPDGTDEFKE